MSSITASGAGFSNVLTGQRQLSSFVHPWGMYWIRDVSQMPYYGLVIGTEYVLV